MKKVFIFVVFMLLLSVKTFSQTESFLFFQQPSRALSDRPIIYIGQPRLLFYVNLENNVVVSYTIGSDYVRNTFRIVINHASFSNFRDALNRFVEWESIATSNNLTDGFRREIPVTVSSNNVRWYRFGVFSPRFSYKMADNATLLLRFYFNWSPGRIMEWERCLFEIRSNSVRLSNNDNFSFVKTRMPLIEVKHLLYNLSDERIQEGISQGRALIQEREEQRQLQDELFR